MSTVLISLALCLFVSAIPSCTYTVYSAGTKAELHTWNNDKVKCHILFLVLLKEFLLLMEKKVLNYFIIVINN